MSEREYSAHSGLSRGAIQKARKASRLVVYKDGSINATASDVRRAEMTDPDQQRRSTGRTGGDSGFSGPADSSSYLKARTALTVYQAQDKQLAIQKRKGTLVDRARAEALVFRLARQERDTWVTWPARVAALMAAEVAAEVEKQTAKPVTIAAAILQRVLETHVRQHLETLADLRSASDSDGTANDDLTADLDLGFDGAEDILRAWRRGMRPDPDLTVSETLSRPLVEALHAWFIEQRARMSKHNPVAKAIAYMIGKAGRWEAFTAFLDDGRICLTNNAAERALRGVALGRKSWLFAGSERGGELAAFM